MSSSLPATFLGAFQGTISILLTIASGFAATRLGFLDSHTIHRLSKLCSKLFMPCLIFTQMGPGITIDRLELLWVIPVWGFISSLISHGIGFFGRSAFGFPSWAILAAGRANSSALPLLLLQSLEQVGILNILKAPGESSPATLARARSFILLNTIVQEVLTFTVGEWILRLDSYDSKYPNSPTSITRSISRRSSNVQSAEVVNLLDDQDSPFDEEEGDFISSMHRPNESVSHEVKRLNKWLVRVTSYLNPVTASALLATLFGLVPPLHHAFFDANGLFFPTITQPLFNLGQLFIVLQTFVVGAELQAIQTAHPGIFPTVFSLLVRYLVMPVIAIGFVLLTARKGFYVDDPLLWFLLIMIPSGPSAMLLMSIAENAGVAQGPIAGYLAIAYACAPLISIWCAVSLKVIDYIKAS